MINKYEQITGMILIYPLTVAIIIESDEDNMHLFLKKIDEYTDNSNEFFTSARIVSTCENCPCRIFKKQIVQIVTRAREQEVDIEADGFANNANFLLNNLITIGKKLYDSNLSDEDYQAAINTMSKGFAQYLPSNERILKYSECDSFYPISEFVKEFCTPVNSYARNDKEWPQQYSIPAWIVITQQLYSNDDENQNTT